DRDKTETIKWWSPDQDRSRLPDLKDAEAVQKFFLEEIQLGEELLAQGDYEKGVDHLTNAIAVCGQPQQLLQVLQQTLPPPVFQMLLTKLPSISQLPTPRRNVWERRPRAESPTPDLTAEYEVETVAQPDHDYSLNPATAAMANQVADENEVLKMQVRELQLQLEVLQLRSRFGIQRLAGSDKDIRFYTRFATYKHFLVFWKLVEPAANTKMVRITNAKASSTSSSDSSQPTTTVCSIQAWINPSIDELLLFLMHLSVGLHLRDLAERFGIHRTTVSRIISTWTHFLYQLLGSKRLWIPREVVRAHLPPEFSAFPDTQVVLDCTEVFCQTPSSLLLQSEVFSTYKSHATFKAMIGMAPHGAITFVSGLYAGSMSDREIFKLSGIVSLLTPDMATMVDKGFLVENLVQSLPACLSVKNNNK
ncbi:hypothetical protein JOQ06_022093, partial [Pogonophryne albipinna]